MQGCDPILEQVGEDSRVKQAWYWEGNIYVKDQQDRTTQVEWGLSSKDLFKTWRA